MKKIIILIVVIFAIFIIGCEIPGTDIEFPYKCDWGDEIQHTNNVSTNATSINLEIIKKSLTNNFNMICC
jgi:hypothetical protein